MVLFVFITQTSAIAAQCQVTDSYYGTMGLKSDSTVVALENNEYGQLNVGECEWH